MLYYVSVQMTQPYNEIPGPVAAMLRFGTTINSPFPNFEIDALKRQSILKKVIALEASYSGGRARSFQPFVCPDV